MSNYYLPTLELWFGRRLQKILGRAPPAAHVARVLSRLPSIAKKTRPNRMNCLIRLLSGGVFLDFACDGQMLCIVAAGCGGANQLNHYLFSSCWHSPRLRREFGGCTRIYDTLVSSYTSLSDWIKAAEVAFCLVSALHECTFNPHLAPRAPVEHFFLYRRRWCNSGLGCYLLCSSVIALARAWRCSWRSATTCLHSLSELGVSCSWC